MTKRIATLLAVALFVFAVPVQAQLGVALGATVPTSDYGEFADTGWMAGVAYLIPLGDGGFVVAPDVYYGSNGHTDSADKTNLYGGNANLGLMLGDGESVTPFVFGSVGLLAHSFSPESGEGGTDTGVSFGGGAGLQFPMGLFIEGRWTTSSPGDSAGNTSFFWLGGGWIFGG